MIRGTVVLSLSLSVVTSALAAQGAAPAPGDRFGLRDIFELEWAGDPQISPDGQRVAFTRGGYDIMKDGEHSALWLVNADGTGLRPLLEPGREAAAPRWSPDGTRLLFVSALAGKADLFVRWMDSGQEAKLTHLEESPGGFAWSPDGKWIAFTMFVPEEAKPFVQLPAPPKGADWGPPIKFIDKVTYRSNGVGYLRDGHRHIFVLPAEGGTPRQLTDGPYDDGAPQWTPDGTTILFAANRHQNADLEPNDSEIYEVAVAGGAPRALTSRKGPDGEPAISPDGRTIAYTGFDDRYQGYQVTHLYVMNRDGSGSRLVSGKFDRDVGNLTWSRDGKGLYFQYDDQGDTKIGYMTLDGTETVVASHVGGLDLGRPYPGGSYSVSNTGRFAFTMTMPDHPADVAVAAAGQPAARLTNLNDDLFAHKTLGERRGDLVRVVVRQATHRGVDPEAARLQPVRRSTRCCSRSMAARSSTTATGGPPSCSCTPRPDTWCSTRIRAGPRATARSSGTSSTTTTRTTTSTTSCPASTR